MDLSGFIGKFAPFFGIILLLGLIGYGLTNASSNTQNSLKIGDEAPDFTLSSVEGGTFTLSNYKGKKDVLLFFQEGIMCPPCWQQQVDMEKRKTEFDALDVKLVMITVDPPNALLQTKEQYGIRELLLYDNQLKASKLYGVLKDSMHPGERPGHVFVLVGKDGKVKWYYSAYKPTTTDSHGHPSGGSMYVSVTNILSNIKAALLA